LVRAALALRHFLRRLSDALVPGNLIMLEMTTGLALTHLLGAVARFGIADELAKGPATAADLARRLALDENALFRTLRALSMRGVFVMLADGRFANDRLASALMSGSASRTREWALYFSSGSNVAAWGDFAETLRTGVSAFDRVHGMTVWAWFDAHADEREMFAHVMMGLTSNDAPAIAAMYPFQEIDVLCDVGGGRGLLLSELLLRFPGMRGVLAERASVLGSARELLASRGVLDRAQLVAGDFFESVPQGASAYLLKSVLHDWDDEACRRILLAVRRAARPGARLLVCETLISQDVSDHFATMSDLQMMVVCSNGKERTLQEIQELLRSTGFRYRRHFAFPSVTVIEGVV
jgi:hypothetical protein